VGQVHGNELASKVMSLGMPDPVTIDSNSSPATWLSTLLGDLLIDYAQLSSFEPIGEGGFATVYRAQLTHRDGSKEMVAVKKLRPERVQSEEDLKEFIAVCSPAAL
jgi:serine/threonine protein kinase